MVATLKKCVIGAEEATAFFLSGCPRNTGTTTAGEKASSCLLYNYLSQSYRQGGVMRGPILATQ